jgi:hypothetical protein
MLYKLILTEILISVHVNLHLQRVHDTFAAQTDSHSRLLTLFNSNIIYLLVSFLHKYYKVFEYMLSEAEESGQGEESTLITLATSHLKLSLCQALKWDFESINN